MSAASPLDTLRAQHQHILDYEDQREKRRGARTTRELPPQVDTYRRHLEQWRAVAKHCGSDEASPLQPLFEKWSAELGRPVGQAPEQAPAPRKGTARTPSGKSPASGKGKGKGGKPAKAADKDATAKGAAAQASDAAPATPGAEPDESRQPDDAGDSSDSATYNILGKGDWLESHAKIVREQVPQVKAAAADPKKYQEAKRGFLNRNLLHVRNYAKKPLKGHSPLFAYCIMYLSDAGKTAEAIKLAETALELRQTSPIKRNYHELLFDVRWAEMERQAEAVATSQKGATFEQLTAMRDQLMADPFRGNHAKAKVCKTFANAAMAIGQYDAARKNLQQVKFLDPNMGVETMLAQCDEKLAG